MIVEIRKILQKIQSKFTSHANAYYQNEDGVVAIEFALVGLPFFLLMFAIIELSLIFIAEVNITHATTESARKVRTLQDGINTIDEFRTDVCSTVVFIPNCIGKLQVEVKVYADFDSIDHEDPVDSNGDLKDNFVYNKGGSGAIVTVRTFVEWEIFAKVPALGFSNMANGNRLIQGFAAFRNE